MFRMISMNQLEVYLESRMDLVLLDVRSPEEFATGHLYGAVNIPLEILEKQGIDLGRERPVMVYCAHGSKSLLAARMLDSQGIPVFACAGGLASYRGRFYVDRQL